MQQPEPQRVDPSPTAQIANNDRYEATDYEQRDGEMQRKNHICQHLKRWIRVGGHDCELCSLTCGLGMHRFGFPLKHLPQRNIENLRDAERCLQ